MGTSAINMWASIASQLSSVMESSLSLEKICRSSSSLESSIPLCDDTMFASSAESSEAG